MGTSLFNITPTPTSTATPTPTPPPTPSPSPSALPQPIPSPSANNIISNDPSLKNRIMIEGGIVPKIQGALSQFGTNEYVGPDQGSGAQSLFASTVGEAITSAVAPPTQRYVLEQDAILKAEILALFNAFVADVNAKIDLGNQTINRVSTQLSQDLTNTAQSLQSSVQQVGSQSQISIESLSAQVNSLASSLTSIQDRINILSENLKSSIAELNQAIQNIQNKTVD